MSCRVGLVGSAVVLGLVVACRSSPPMRYYTLTDMAPQGVPVDGNPAVPVRLERVAIPAELDRSQVVRRIDATRLQIAELDRWAAPLDEMIRRVLSSDLAARLPTGQVLDPDQTRSGRPFQGLSVHVQDFYADLGCAVTLRASWLLNSPRGAGPGHDSGESHAAPDDPARKPLQGSEVLHVPAAGSCPAALAEGMSRALAELSDRIARAIAGPAPGT